jgi:cytochrome c5
MKKISFILSFIFIVVTFTQAINYLHTEPTYIPETIQKKGDAKKGYEYLINGDFLKSGIPYDFFILFYGKNKTNYLQRTGKAANVEHGFNVINAPNGVEVVIPTCLQCHAQVFNDSLYVGMGNSFMDFTTIANNNNSFTNIGINGLKTFNNKGYVAAEAILQSYRTISKYLTTAVQGVNAADRLATVLVAHRNAETLEWQKEPVLNIPNQVIPTDVPAWWLLKKKHAMFYNGFGRGDFGKFLMLSNILTVKDTAEAREVYSHFADVLAYIKSIEPPPYPKTIDSTLANKGEIIFTNHCSKCHGTYGSNATYPNLLIPGNIIKTDSLLYSSNYQQPQFIEWFNNSWFAKGPDAAKLVPFNGYIAPPLDGIWATAPYLHNGSVPTLEAVLKSELRPTYWSRNFKKPEYNYESVGWQYESHDKANSKKIYNTQLPGYGNYGHYFGDKLSNEERKALIEYLKTL